MISIVVPIHNEQEVISSLYSRLTAAAEGWGVPFEVIAVDDGSRDRSSEMLAEIHDRDPRWKLLCLSRNFGHQPAVSAGLHYAVGDAVVILDADLQDPPEVVAQMLARWREGFQVVYAVRRKRKESLLKRTAYSAFYRVLQKVANIDVPLDSGDFCVMDRSVVDALRSLPERNRFVRGLRCWVGFRSIGVEYERHARHAGETKYTLSKLVRLAADGIFSFSSLPLKLASWAGFAMCGLAAFGAALVVAWKICDVSVLGMKPSAAVGWSSLMCLMLLIGGIQLVVMGIIGEYLARVFDEVKGRPAWIVARSLGIESEQPGVLRWRLPPPSAPMRAVG